AVTEEHVLGAREADPLRAELARAPCVLGCIGVRAHLEPANLVGPRQKRGELGGHLRLLQRDLAEVDLPGRAIDRDDVALVYEDVADAEAARADVDVERVGATNARLA